MAGTLPLFDTAASAAAPDVSGPDVETCFDAVPPDWRPITQGFRAQAVGQQLISRLQAEVSAGHTVYPNELFAALHLTRLADVRVVILGQDPYHGPGQAHGLAFSVPPGCKVPPSLRNIFKELQRDLGLPAPASGDLRAWAQRGVLLLNTALTVRADEAGSHSGWGWEALTDALMAQVAAQPSPKVFMLWGAHAQRKRELIEQAGADNAAPQLILACNHPSPLSAMRGDAPFIGCGHFGQAQAWLQRQAGQQAMPGLWPL
jgi:uracil-DNA glycosylase